MAETDGTSREKELQEASVSQVSSEAREPAVTEALNGGEGPAGPRRQVDKPNVLPTTVLRLYRSDAGLVLDSSMALEHGSARRLLDASYVLQPAHPDAAPATKTEPAAAKEATGVARGSEKRLQRARKPLGPAFFRVGAGTCALVLAVLGGVTAYAGFDKNTVSESENRTLAGAPNLNMQTWSDGSFQTDAELFLSDHLFGRQGFIDVAKSFEKLIEVDADVRVERGANINEGTGDGGMVDVAIQQAEDQRYIVLDDRVVLAYEHNQPTLDYFVTCTNTLFNSLPEGIQRYVMVAPSRISFETDEVKAQSDDPSEDIRSVLGAFDSSVITVNAYDALEPHADDPGLYFRTDHHWTMLGAYYAAEALCKAAGTKDLVLKEYTKETGPSFLGYLSASFTSNNMRNYPDELVYYHKGEIKDCVLEIAGKGDKTSIEKAKVIDVERGGYYSFVGRLFASARIEGNPKSDRTIMVVSDSYAQTIAPWLADSFGKVILIDPRFFTGGHEGMIDLIESEGVTDFMVLQSSLNLPYATFSALIGKLGG